MNKPLVLVVEDDKSVRNLLTTALEVHGFQSRAAETGMASLQEALSYKPDVILLDLGLPDMDGMDLLAKIRSWSRVPVLVVSARQEDKDKVDAFNAGADDYITKPFSVDELVARVRAVLRRTQYAAESPAESENVVQNGCLRIDFAAGCVYMNDQELHVTPLEYKLLCLFARNIGKVLTHQYLSKEIWGRNAEADSSHLRVFMAALRKKVEGGQQIFQTHIGVGYRMLNARQGDEQ